jgi:5-methylcytosine-specific restriction protein A
MSVWPYSTQRWQRLRKLKLQVNPCCEKCLNDGRVEPASHVDHIVPVNKGGNPFPPLDEMDSLCAACHNTKTRYEQIGKPLKRRGCDVNGKPLDPGN